MASFQTTRSRNSELWFVNNSQLEQAILGYTARYCTRYGVKLFAFAIEGNHIQQVNQFPNANRAHYMRDLNSSVARAVARYQREYPGGTFWGRRYSAEHLPGDPDIEEYFFYTVLQPVNDGLVDDIKDYPGYNCFEDAITGRERQFKVIKWKEYNDAKRWRSDISIDDFVEICTLKYSRLPGYENLSQLEYEIIMREKLKQRTERILRKARRKPCVGPELLQLTKPGALPRKTKKSTRWQHRPRVLSRSRVRRATAEAWYFNTCFEFRRSSKEYRAGNLEVEFPKGTYKPPIFTVAFTGTLC